MWESGSVEAERLEKMIFLGLVFVYVVYVLDMKHE